MIFGITFRVNLIMILKNIFNLFNNSKFLSSEQKENLKIFFKIITKCNRIHKHLF